MERGTRRVLLRDLLQRFPHPSCELHISTPINCELLATQVVETSYRHASPGVYDNSYWVVACNRMGCTEIDSENPVAPVYAGPSALPDNVEYRRDGTAIVVSWNAAPDADYYNVYYDDLASCSLPSSTLDTLGIFSALSNRRSCEELATDLIETTYTHTSPGDDENYYWVVACNSGGCTDIDSENPATFVDTRPSAPPGNVEYRRDGTVIVVSWNTVPDADYYRIFYDDTFGSSCGLHRGIAIGCDELATNVVDTTYTHTSPVDGDNYYWVAACNSNGCTDTESEDPATFVDTRPSALPANVQYRRDGTAIVVSWSGVPDADYYKIYYTDSAVSICKSIGDTLVVCEELATNVVGTTYTHTSPDDDYNHYWVAACNSNGCTDIDSENPATFVDTRPSATIEG